MKHSKKARVAACGVDVLNDETLLNIFRYLPAGRVLTAVCRRWRYIIFKSENMILCAKWYHNWVHGYARSFTNAEIMEMIKYGCLDCVRVNHINIDDCIHELKFVRNDLISLIRDLEYVFITVMLNGSNLCLSSFMTLITNHFNRLSVWGMGAKYQTLLQNIRRYAILIAEWDAPNTQTSDIIAAEILGRELRAYAAMSDLQRSQRILRDGKIALIAALILHNCIPEQTRFTCALWRHINTWLQRRNMTVAPIYDVDYFTWHAAAEHVLINIAAIINKSTSLYPLACRMCDAPQIGLHFTVRQICDTMRICSIIGNTKLFVILHIALFLKIISSGKINHKGVMNKEAIGALYINILQQENRALFGDAIVYYTDSTTMINYLLTIKCKFVATNPYARWYMGSVTSGYHAGLMQIRLADFVMSELKKYSVLRA